MKTFEQIANETILKWVFGYKDGCNTIAWSDNAEIESGNIMITNGYVCYILPPKFVQIKLPEERHNNSLSTRQYVTRDDYRLIDINKRSVLYNGKKRGEFIPIENNLYIDAQYIKMFPDCTFWYAAKTHGVVKVLLGDTYTFVGIIMMTRHNGDNNA